MSNERFFFVVCYDVANDNVNIKIYNVIGYESMSSFFLCHGYFVHDFKPPDVLAKKLQEIAMGLMLFSYQIMMTS